MVVVERGQGSAGRRLDSIGTMPEVSGQIESKSDVDWLLLSDDVLPVADAYDWAVQPSCGAVVLFSGTVRNHAEGRDGVESLTYEAYEDQVVARFAEIVAETRRRWPDTGRIAIHHRTGRLEVTESSVVTVVSAPHRGEAFEAGRYAIDALKESAPIWKHEVWVDGADWGTGSHDLAPASDVTSADFASEGGT
jgi:molybdopterin synthase catalytic subunit